MSLRALAKGFSTSVPPTNPSRRTGAFSLLAAVGSISAAAYLLYPSETRHAPTYANAQLSPAHFTRSLVVSTEDTGPDTKLITVRVPPQSNAPSLASVWSVFIKDDDIQVERPYTPLKRIDEDGRMQFWIKKYQSGEVGRWLHTKAVGEQIELRGPLQTWAWQDDVWDDVVMISGGTGITPFCQLFDSVIRHTSTSPRTRFHLLHCSRNLSQLPPTSMMQPMSDFGKQNSGRFHMQLYVDSLDTSSSTDSLVAAGRVDRHALENTLGMHNSSWWPWSQKSTERSRKTLFLVCGPEPMIASIAGPYGRNFSQGPIGGLLQDMGYSASDVYKL